jgi:hypothetical protein
LWRIDGSLPSKHWLQEYSGTVERFHFCTDAEHMLCQNFFQGCLTRERYTWAMSASIRMNLG